MEFVSIDVETANADMASICQVGIARFVEGKLVDEWSSLVDPEDYFDPINVSIHGINNTDIVGAPTFEQVADAIETLLTNKICVSHTHFDRVSIERALRRYRRGDICTTWLDSARVARRTWNQCAWRGYGLADVCDLIGHAFNHHDALEDAKASGYVLLAAIEKTGLSVDAWLRRVRQPIDPESSSTGSAICREGNPDGALYGEVIVFTGALDITRAEAADLAARIGCSVAQSVTYKTTVLVVGDQDVTKLSGKSKSRKHIKAEELIMKGQSIKIIKETDFKEMIKQVQDGA